MAWTTRWRVARTACAWPSRLTSPAPSPFGSQGYKARWFSAARDPQRTPSSRVAALPAARTALGRALRFVLRPPLEVCAGAIFAVNLGCFVGIDKRMLSKHLAPSWISCTCQGRWSALLVAQFNHDDWEHLVGNTVMLFGCTMLLSGTVSPALFLGSYLVSGVVGTSASVLHTAWMYAPPDAVAACGLCDYNALNDYIERRDANLRWGFDGIATRHEQPGPGNSVYESEGKDLRHDVPQLVALYSPYKVWMEESTRKTRGASASVSGLAALLGTHSALALASAVRTAGVRGVGPAQLLPLAISAAFLLVPASELAALSAKTAATAATVVTEPINAERELQYDAVAHVAGWACGAILSSALLLL